MLSVHAEQQSSPSSFHSTLFPLLAVLLLAPDTTGFTIRVQGSLLSHPRRTFDQSRIFDLKARGIIVAGVLRFSPEGTQQEGAKILGFVPHTCWT